MRTQYFWPFEKALEVIFGAFLLTNNFVVLAIDGLAAIIINILLFHIFLDPKGIPLAIIITILELILVASYWNDHFKSTFSRKS